MKNSLVKKEKRELDNLYQIFDSPRDGLRRKMLTCLYLGIILLFSAGLVAAALDVTIGIILGILAALAIIISGVGLCTIR